jgi:hypothetical protein
MDGSQVGGRGSNSCASVKRPKDTDRWRQTARACASVLLLAAATLKLLPHEGIGSTLLAEPLPRWGVALAEGALAVAILLPAWGAFATRVTILFTGALGLLSVSLHLAAGPACGCFGGWLPRAPWIHALALGVLGLLLVGSLPTSVGKGSSGTGDAK